MEYQQAYALWLNSPQVDEETKHELRLLEQDEGQKQYRFMKMLDFGTAGLRGIFEYDEYLYCAVYNAGIG